MNRAKNIIFRRWILNQASAGARRAGLGLALAGWAAGNALAGPLAPDFQKEIQPLLKQYCYDCHGEGESKGKITLDTLKPEAGAADHELWLKVLNNVRAGLMPPPKKPQPDAAAREKLDHWIKYGAFGIDPQNPDPGRVTVRRMNRVEYRNTVRDLLGVEFNALAEFPPDDTGYGFDNIGDVLTVSPMLLEKYLAAAYQVVADSVPVVGRVLPERLIPGTRFKGVDGGGNSGGRPGGNGGNQRNPGLTLSFYKPAAVSNTFTIDVAGDYQLVFNLAVRGNFEFDPGRCRVTVRLDGKELLKEEFGWYNDKAFPREFPARLVTGEHVATLTLEPLKSEAEKKNNLDLRLVSLNLRGPLDEKQWKQPPNYAKFFPRPDAPLDAAGRRAYAREILTAFATKAFRRPVDEATVDRLTHLAESVYQEPGKTFEAGIAHAMVGVLASPRFTFRMEANVKTQGDPQWALIDEYSLASRLSYFLWSTMPDAELIGLAAKGQLRQNLAAQVKRMLADDRADSLAQNFTGQWLEARDVDALAIDSRAVFTRDGNPGDFTNGPPRDFGNFRRTNGPAGFAGGRRGAGGTNNATGTNLTDVALGGTNLAGTNLLAAAGNGTNALSAAEQRRRNFNNGGRRGFNRLQLDGNLKRSMRKETEMLFSHIVQEDRNIIEFIESDYIYLDANLAKAYGMTNLDLSGTEMTLVKLPAGSPRGGVLTEGTVLTVTSNPDRTSPVKRGLFILNNILGTPVPPPPPNVPSLEASEKDFKGGHQPTLREALAVHRENALCSSCHSRMDPLGLGMENFNALGMWREKERGQTIDPAGTLVSGETFSGIQELKHVLATTHKLEFYRCLTQKLLTYAIGRGPEYYDVESTDQIVRRLEKENGRFSALLMGVIESAPFQAQRTHSTATFADGAEPTAAPQLVNR